MNGIWGQLAVGFFADPPSGPKGLFLGGGPFQLTVQAISSFCLTVWSFTVTVLILWVVNKIIPIRLDPEDEEKGCDCTQHFVGVDLDDEMQKPPIFDRVISLPSPVAQKFSGPTDARLPPDFKDFGRRKDFYTNDAYVQDGRM